jgi:hypothetical protein
VHHFGERLHLQRLHLDGGCGHFTRWLDSRHALVAGLVVGVCLGLLASWPLSRDYGNVADFVVCAKKDAKRKHSYKKTPKRRLRSAEGEKNSYVANVKEQTTSSA